VAGSESAVVTDRKKKLIEVALPLEAINREAAREKSIRHGHPSTLHLWWARRPLAACRAVLFAQLVDDPSAHPDIWPTQEAQDAERQRLFGIIERLVKWENTNNEGVLAEARAEIRRSCGENPPTILDPFCGGGSIPLEAQRLGLEAHASDLNPVAVLITKALIEIPPRWAGCPPVHPDAIRRAVWHGAQGLAEDVRRYARWMRDEAERRIGHHYPKASLPDGREATVITWLWARTVTCPNPACRATMPLLNSLSLSTRQGHEAWLRPQPDVAARRVRFEIGLGPGRPSGGSVARSGATCLVCGSPVPLSYVRAEGKADRMGVQLVAVVAEGTRTRHFLPATADHEAAAEHVERPVAVPDTELPEQALGFRVQGYGLKRHADLFTNRQLVTMTTFCDLVGEARERIVKARGDEVYADAVAVYLTLSIGRLANRGSSLCLWHPGRHTVEQVFARNALPMIWVFAEGNPFSASTGNYLGQVEYLAEALEGTPAKGAGVATQADAATGPPLLAVCVATDPPYYDNVPYGDLSDFFYVWLRRAAGGLYPELFGTVLVPKTAELIAEPARHGGWDEAAAFFRSGLQRSFQRMREAQISGFPLTLFYAFKQAEDDGQVEASRASTGWETMLEGLLNAGCAVTGTWPMRTEQAGGLRELGRNSLASSIMLVCRPRPESASITDRRGFLGALKAELPAALRDLQQGSVAPVDLAQAAIGPGMAVFSRFAKVVEPSGEPMRVRTALGLINQVLDEVLAEQEGEFDADTRWAIKWFEQFGLDEGPYGQAEVLTTATNTSVGGLREAGILQAREGKVWLLGRDDLPSHWNPTRDRRTPVWEVAQHLVKRLEESGEQSAAELLRSVGGLGDVARDLAYRLFVVCERKKWAKEALAFNALVVSWPEIARLAGAAPMPEAPVQQTLA
jgi:putative DNA methylase